ncbi:MAG: hypothetical protein PWQ77_1087 [Kosmotogales bacterium]|nr:hypothetical protein [Kosmotogales bacterium]
MPYEKEKKYILYLKDEDRDMFIAKNSNKIQKAGIIQWYLIEEIRIRLQIEYMNGNFHEKWIEGRKTLTDNVLIRKEDEKNFIPENSSFIQNLSNYPFVIKIRHYLKTVKNVKECILDEFLIEKHPNTGNLKYLMEIELINEKTGDEVFDNQLKILNFMNFKYEDVTSHKKYSNKYLAVKNKKANQQELIEHLKKILVG